MQDATGIPSPDPTYVLRVADLPQRREVTFEVAPQAETCKALAADLGITDLRKFRLRGRLSPSGKKDWHLEAQLGATVVQPCVVTLAPVTTRIEEPVARIFLADPAPEPEGETEMPEDDGTEALGDIIDLWIIAQEALALALPAYPRADGAEMGAAQFAGPGITPLSDDAVKPFSGLAALRDKLKDQDG